MQHDLRLQHAAASQTLGPKPFHYEGHFCRQGEQCVQGTPLKSGTSLRLQHAATRKWLHSHHFASPLSNNQEVCMSAAHIFHLPSTNEEIALVQLAIFKIKTLFTLTQSNCSHIVVMLL